MRFFFALLLAAPLMSASNILSTKIDAKPSSAEILLTFDTPYEGEIRQSTRENSIVIRLTEASIESPSIDKLTSTLADKVSITPLGDQTQIVVEAAAPIVLSALKSSDAYGLKLRVAQPLVAQEKYAESPSSGFNSRYSIVAAVVLSGIAVFFLLMRRVSMPYKSPIKTVLLGKTGGVTDEATVRFQKPIDENNHIALIDYAGTSYLVILGTSNLLLEKFRGSEAMDSDAFEELLEAKCCEIDAFVVRETKREEIVEPLESYKAKASGA
jgi:hypothetical protein